MSVRFYGIIILLIYLGITVLIGAYSARQQEGAEDFLVGGRNFGTPIMVMSLLASIMHGGSIISGVASSAVYGGVATLPYIGFALGMLVILRVFAKPLREMEVVTLPDYMGKRFNSKNLQAFTAVVVVIANTLNLVAQIRGMGVIFQGILGTSFEVSMLIGTVILVGYVAAGGLTAAILNNVVQFSFMWLGLLILVPFLLPETGGWSNVFVQVDKIAPGWTSPTGTQWTWLFLFSWTLNWFVAYATRVELITKVFAAKDSKTARFAIPWTLLLVMVFLMYGNMYLGAASRVLVWDKVAIPDQAFTTLVNEYTTPLVAGFAMVGIAAAAMSTSDALLLNSGAAISYDILRTWYHEPRGIEKDEKFYIRVSRLTILAVGIIAYLGALNTPEMILNIVSYAVAIVGATFFAPMVVGLTMKRVSTEAAFASSVSGFVAAAIHVVLLLKDVSWASVLHPSITGVGVSFIVIFVVNAFTKPEEEIDFEDLKAESQKTIS